VHAQPVTQRVESRLGLGRYRGASRRMNCNRREGFALREPLCALIGSNVQQ
jgi:hypothetical protein